MELVRADIRAFKKERACDRLVAIWCASTEVFLRATEVHQSIKAFEAGLAANAPEISNAQIYAWACIKEGVPLANGAPNSCAWISRPPGSSRSRAPCAARGKRFQDGSNAPQDGAGSGVQGTNAWPARMVPRRTSSATEDGEVLRRPRLFFRAKGGLQAGGARGDSPAEASYPEPLRRRRAQGQHPLLPPCEGTRRRRAGTTSISLGGSGYPMQIKGQFPLPRLDTHAAPIVLDLALFMRPPLAEEQGFRGIQEWLSFLFQESDACTRPLTRSMTFSSS